MVAIFAEGYQVRTLVLRISPLFQKAIFFQAGNDLRYVHAIHTGKACDLMLSDLLTVSG